MNKKELAKAVSVQTDVDFKTVTSVLDGFTDVVTAVVAKGEPVAITGFAKFVKVQRGARMGRNPATGEQIRIKASKKARITPLKGFKDAVLAPSAAPKLKKGAHPIDEAAVKAAGMVAPAPGRRAPAKKAAATRRPAKKGAPTRRAPTKKAAATRRPAKKTAAKRAR
jgi:DNA-binding protein HU-beta